MDIIIHLLDYVNDFVIFNFWKFEDFHYNPNPHDYWVYGFGVSILCLVSIKPIVVTSKNPWQASTYNKKIKGARRCLTEVEVRL